MVEGQSRIGRAIGRDELAAARFAPHDGDGLQRLGGHLEVTEAALNHVAGSRAGVVGIYQRHDFAMEKRAALEAWGEHFVAAVEGRGAASNVISLTQRA